MDTSRGDFQRVNHTPIRRAHDAQAGGAASDGEQCSGRSEGYTSDSIGRGLQLEQWPCRANIPELQASIWAAGQELLPVGRKMHNPAPAGLHLDGGARLCPFWKPKYAV